MIEIPFFDKLRAKVDNINRTQAEYDAAETFWNAHFPYTHFTYRDYRFYPYRDVEVVIVPGSAFRETGTDVTLRFNYAFDVAEP